MHVGSECQIHSTGVMARRPGRGNYRKGVASRNMPRAVRGPRPRHAARCPQR